MGTNSNVNRASDILYLLMLQDGVTPFDSRGMPSFAQSVQKTGKLLSRAGCLEFLYFFCQSCECELQLEPGSDYSIDAFANGRAAFLISYYYTRSSLLQKNPNLNFDVAPIPQPSLDVPAVNFSNYWGEVVSKQTKNPTAAWTF